MFRDSLIHSEWQYLIPEKIAVNKQEKAAKHSEEENAIMSALRRSFPFEEYAYRDTPEGTIVTVPYYTDLNVLVIRK